MKQPDRTGRGNGETPTHPGLLATPPGLLATPLDFIVEDHMRERQVCALIDQLAAAAPLDRQAAVTVLRFLNEELNVHMRDEAEDLFPMLAQRCSTEDAIDTAITRIKTDQGAAMRLLPGVRAAILGCLDTGSDLSAGQRTKLCRFAGYLRRHIAAENAILLPIARVRLTRSDLRLLSRQMRSRRGLPPAAEVCDAD